MDELLKYFLKTFPIMINVRHNLKSVFQNLILQILVGSQLTLSFTRKTTIA